MIKKEAKSKKPSLSKTAQSKTAQSKAVKKTSARGAKPKKNKILRTLKAIKTSRARKKAISHVLGKHLHTEIPKEIAEDLMSNRRRGVYSSSHRIQNSQFQVSRYYTLGVMTFAVVLVFLGYQGVRARRGMDVATKPATTIDSTASLKTEDKGAQLRSDNSRELEESNSETGNTASATESGPMASEFKAIENFSLDRKIQYWSKYLEGNLVGRKKLATLAEGIEIADVAPLVPNQFDCTTFVETVVALSRSDTSKSFVKNLLAIRYNGGQASFAQRNHFPEVDWIPNNQKADILRDITRSIAQKSGVFTKVETKQFDRAKWFESQVRRHSNYRKLASEVHEAWLNPVDGEVSYIDVAQIDKITSEIPNGTVINFVHKNDERHPVLIAHQGFAIRNGNRVLLRHASIGGRVRTTDLSYYIQGILKLQGQSSDWPLIGVNFNQINEAASDSNLFKQSM